MEENGLTENKENYVISVLSQDRVGIIAKVSSAIFDLGGNILAISQTISKGWFTMVTHVEFPGKLTGNDIKDAIEKTGDLQVIVSQTKSDVIEDKSKGEPFVVTVVGDDKSGIVKKLASCFAEKKINIDDVWNEVCDGRFIVIFHVELPNDIDPGEVRFELEKIGEEIGVSVMLQHQDIFTATNSLSANTCK